MDGSGRGDGPPVAMRGDFSFFSPIHDLTRSRLEVEVSGTGAW